MYLAYIDIFLGFCIVGGIIALACSGIVILYQEIKKRLKSKNGTTVR